MAKILLVGAGAAAQLGEQLLSMCEALSSIPSTPEKQNQPWEWIFPSPMMTGCALGKASWAVTLNKLMQPGVRGKALAHQPLAAASVLCLSPSNTALKAKHIHVYPIGG